jgi:serine/threonine protein kinase
VRILRDVVSALAYAHANGVVHRDVKPDNVLLSGGVAVVTDFGVAKAVSASSGGAAASGLTSLGVALGTPAYMAPEQATASPHTDHRADIYAFGIMAYELLTGHPPFVGRSAQAVLAAQVVEDPEPVERRRPAVPPMLAALVRECIAKRPAERPQTAGQVMHVLDSIVTPSGGTAATTAVRLPSIQPAESYRRKWPLVGGAVAVAALLGGGVLWLRRNPPAAVPAAGSVARSESTVPPRPQITPAPVQPPRPVPAPAVVADVPSSKTARRDKVRSETPKPPAPVTRDTFISNLATEPPPALESVPSPAVAAAPPAIPPPQPVAESTPPPAPPVAAPKPAPKPADPRTEIQGVVGEYARAIESKNLQDLQRVYPGMTGIQQRGWEQFFQLVRDVNARLSVGGLNVSGGTADAQITGTYNYLNTSTGRAENQPVSFHASFRQEGGRWRITPVR